MKREGKLVGSDRLRQRELPITKMESAGKAVVYFNFFPGYILGCVLNKLQ